MLSQCKKKERCVAHSHGVVRINAVSHSFYTTTWWQWFCIAWHSLVTVKQPHYKKFYKQCTIHVHIYTLWITTTKQIIIISIQHIYTCAQVKQRIKCQYEIIIICTSSQLVICNTTKYCIYLLDFTRALNTSSTLISCPIYCVW